MFSRYIPSGQALRTTRGSLTLTLLIILAAAGGTTFLSGCISASRTPNLERIFAQARGKTGKRPVIVIPGVLGTQLINSKTGETVWPSAFRTTDDGSTLPMSPDLATNR